MSATVAASRSDTPPVPSGGRPLRILHVLDHSLPLHSGYTFRTLAILAGQRALGWETCQLTGPKQDSGQAREEQVGEWLFHRTPLRPGAMARLPLAKHRHLMNTLRVRLAEVVDQVRPDILHAHSPVLDALPALAVGRDAGIPMVYEVRAFWEDAAADLGTAHEWGPRYRLTRAMETRAMQRADAVTTICDGLRADILRRGIPGGKVTVIPNAVDTSRFAFRAAADQALVDQYGLTHGHTLGFAGSFYAYEGLDILLRALPMVLQAAPRVRLLLLGGGPQEESLRMLADQLGLAEAVHFVGRVPHDEVNRYCTVMDVMVYPRISRRLTELVTPLKPLEAMAMGKLVLASDVGGHRELVHDGDNGHLFPAGSPEALAHCLLGLLKAPEAWPQVIGNGRNFVERERTWRSSVACYRAVYEGVLGHTTRRNATHGR